MYKKSKVIRSQKYFSILLMVQIRHYLLKAVVKTAVWKNKSLIDIIAAPEVSLSKSHYHRQKDEVCHEFFPFVENFLCETIHIHYGP